MYLISLHSLFYGICHVVAFALFSLFLFVSLWHAFVGSQNIYMGAGRRKFTRTHTQRTLKIYIARVLVRHTHIFYVLCHFVFALFFVSRPAHLATCSLKISTRTDSLRSCLRLLLRLRSCCWYELGCLRWNAAGLLLVSSCVCVCVCLL